MAHPHTLENSVRLHDLAFYNWLGGLEVDYGNIAGQPHPQEPILRVFASPQRAFATTVDLLVSRDWISGADAQAMRENAGDFSVLPLPICSVEAEPFAPDIRNASSVIHRTASFNLAGQHWEAYQWPGRYIIQYTATFWCLKRYTAVFIDEWVASQLGTLGAGPYEVMLNIDHAEPFGTQLHGMTWTGATDLSDLEGAGQRYIRRQHTFEMNAFLFPSPEQTQDTPLSRVCLEMLDLTNQVFLDYFDALPHPSRWLTEGNAVAKQDTDDGGGLGLITLPDQGDSVTVHAWPTTIYEEGEADEHGLVNLSLEYKSDGPAWLDMIQDGDDGEELVYRIKMPASPSGWVPLHRIIAVTDKAAGLRFSRYPVDKVDNLRFRRASVHNLPEPTRAYNSGASQSGPVTTLVWDNLDASTYVAVVIPDADATVKLHDDATSPETTKEFSFIASRHKGVVLHIQPKADTLSLEVEDGAGVVTAYVFKAPLPYKGDQVDG